MISGHILEDMIACHEYALSAVLHFSGYEIVRISPKGNNVTVEAIVPTLEWTELQKEYRSGLAVSDVRAFGKSWSWLGKAVRDARQTGRPWVNPDYTTMLKEYEQDGEINLCQQKSQ